MTIKSKHNAKQYKCVCGISFTLRNNLYRHKTQCKKSISQKKLSCRCGKVFPRIDNYNRHILKCKEKSSYPCPICKKIFRSTYFVKRHVVIHRKTDSFKCQSCNKDFKREHNLITHETICEKLKRNQIPKENKFTTVLEEIGLEVVKNWLKAYDGTPATTHNSEFNITCESNLGYDELLVPKENSSVGYEKCNGLMEPIENSFTITRKVRYLGDKFVGEVQEKNFCQNEKTQLVNYLSKQLEIKEKSTQPSIAEKRVRKSYPINSKERV